MGRGGRGGGGGRSSGGGSRGGSRSSGGRRGGSSSSRGGFSSSRSSFGGGSRGGFGGGFSSSPGHGGGYRPAPPPPPPGPGYRRRPVYGGGYRPARRVGCVTEILVTIIILMVAIYLLFGMFGGGLSLGGITPSTVTREKLDGQYVTTTDYYYDDMDWIGSGSKLEKGMKSFYQETGVQPFLYLTETVNGSTYPSESEMDAFAKQLYDELFEDEGHVLVVFQEYNSDGNYYCYYVAGKQAKTVFDDEAADILLDYIDQYYYSDMSEEEFFSKAFEKAGERMMEKTESPIVKIVVAVAVVVVLLLAFTWWKKAKEQKNLEAEQTERILNTDIEKLTSESPELEELAKKYQD